MTASVLLKKELTVTDEDLEIFLDPKYIDRVGELLNVVNPKRRRVPCSQDILSGDESDPLSESQISKFREQLVLCYMFLQNVLIFSL